MSCFTNYQLEQLRQQIDWEKWPLNVEDWTIDLNHRTNCLAFALGIPVATSFASMYQPTSLRNFIRDFCFGMNLDFRELYSISEAKDDEIVLQCYEHLLNSRFHVIRRNTDGKWVHKQGWSEAPTELIFNGYFHCMYPPEAKTHIFAIKKKAS